MSQDKLGASKVQLLAAELESATLRDFVQELLPPDERKTPQKKTKRLRGNKPREIDYSGKQSLWHALYKGSDYQLGRVGFGLELPQPQVEEESEVIVENDPIKDNEDEATPPDTLDYIILQSPAALSMMINIKDNQNTLTEPENVLSILGITHAEVSNPQSRSQGSSALESFVFELPIEQSLIAESHVLDSPPENTTIFPDIEIVEANINLTSPGSMVEGHIPEALLATGNIQTPKDNRANTEVLPACSTTAGQQQVNDNSELPIFNPYNKVVVKISNIKVSRVGTGIRTPSRNFWLFFIWFFVMFLQWMSGYHISSYDSPLQDRGVLTQTKIEATLGAESVKPLLITSAPTVLSPTLIVPPIAGKAIPPAQTVFPTMIISPTMIVTPYRIKNLTSLLEGANSEPAHTPKFENLIPTKKEKIGLVILGLFSMVFVASTLCADSII
ncbi:hypothetical protein N431DRAFT_471438 [Stipitochalara longipes BDJ]|nr:hypothetical protein N431DRAFT_471438 [Stipitochalara longipes BDJ]